MTKTITEPVLVLVGPTAIGKTNLSLEISDLHNCEVISMDSMQVYRYMDIGTAKISVDEQRHIPHHLINIVDPDEEYDAAKYCKDAIAAIKEIHAKGKIPLVTGGTGLYLQSLTEGLFQGPPGDPAIRQKLQDQLERIGANSMHHELSLYDNESAKRIHPNDSYRVLRALEVYQATGVPLSEHIERQKTEKIFSNILQIGLTTERNTLYKRINLRTQIMIEQGLEEEVRGLLDKGYGRELKSMKSIGYNHMLHFVFDEWSFEDMQTLLARDTRRYAKRQYTWFNKNKELKWFDVEKRDLVLDEITTWLH